MDKVIKVANEKAKSMIYTNDGVRFIDKDVDTVEKFNEVFEKKISLTNKGELNFRDMKKLSMDELTVDPHVGMKLGNSVSDIVFKFEADRDEFMNHVSNLKGWSRKEVQSSPLNAMKWSLLGLVVTPFAGNYVRNMALQMEVGTFVGETGTGRSARKAKSFQSLVEMVGSTGVTIIALIALAYFIYSCYSLYKNPPMLVTYE
jgi:hypothetical protein